MPATLSPATGLILSMLNYSFELLWAQGVSFLKMKDQRCQWELSASYSDGKYDYGSDVDNVTLINTLDGSHPLQLHPNDYVALTVVSVKLKGTENYQV
ncbi:hypothetical protein Tco_1049291 [Tanacetum coccineum]